MNANEQVFDFTLGQWAGQFQNYESQPRVEKLALIERMRKPENMFLIPTQAHIDRRLEGLCVLRLTPFFAPLVWRKTLSKFSFKQIAGIEEIVRIEEVF